MEVLLLSLIRSIAENFAEEKVTGLLDKLIKKIRSSFVERKLPIQNKIERAIHKSYLLSTLLVCHDMLQIKKGELGWRRFFAENDFINWLKLITKNFEEQLGKINSEDHATPFIEIEIDINQLFKSNKHLNITKENPTQLILENFLVQELRNLEKIPDEFMTLIQKGWINSKTGKKQTWFEVFSGFLAKEVETNDELSRIIQTTLISNFSIPDAEFLHSQINKSVQIVSNEVFSSFGIIANSFAMQMRSQLEIQKAITEINTLFKDLIAEKSKVKISITQKYALRESSQQAERLQLTPLKWLMP